MGVTTPVTVLIALLTPMAAAGGGGPQKPRLNVRVSPSMAFSPVEVHFTAKIVGGKDLEDYHCPEVEWDWDDGERSVREADCAPYQSGAEVERFFTARHLYRREGAYTVRVSVLRAARPIAQASARVHVVSALGGVE